MSRSRHQLLVKRKPKPKSKPKPKPKPKDGTNDDVLGMTKVFLKKEGQEATKPLGKNANIDLTSDEALNLMIDLSKGGGKSKKKERKKKLPPRKKIPVKKKKVTPIPFERTRKLMEEDPDFMGSDDEDFQDLLDSFGNEASTDSSSSAPSFNIPGPIPSAAEQKDNENSLDDWIKFSQEANRQFNEEAALVRIEAALAKGKEVQKNKSGKGGRRKTRKKRRSRRKRKTRRKKRKRKTRRKKN